uniref:Uncharacterized protein n=1 Tax=Arundo donax TaxID=35708 RepID=A0A0A9BQ01_ARUDO
MREQQFIYLSIHISTIASSLIRIHEALHALCNVQSTTIYYCNLLILLLAKEIAN